MMMGTKVLDKCGKRMSIGGIYKNVHQNQNKEHQSPIKQDKWSRKRKQKRSKVTSDICNIEIREICPGRSIHFVISGNQNGEQKGINIPISALELDNLTLIYKVQGQSYGIFAKSIRS